jgi:hypothetical protein
MTEILPASHGTMGLAERIRRVATLEKSYLSGYKRKHKRTRTTYYIVQILKLYGHVYKEEVCKAWIKIQRRLRNRLYANLDIHEE